MSTVGTAERIEDFSTEVTVYRCRNCNSCTCKSGANDFENFKKIADTQNNIFSDVIIELETNKTHTTVCFEEPNFCLEEVYGIFWRRDGGSGLSCGTLSSGENGRGDISTEKTICCEAETDTRRYNPEVKCFYTQKSRPKLKTLPVGDPAERIADGASSFVWCSRGSSWLGTPACFTWMLCFLLLCSL
ncbi:PREDICTED: uncharacterized protein LOC101812190 isoform X4 [Ficedula albicollis]|uniref:uncharacterized protein LOC101812190 isoform X4 n=1 Tax=Ficedula albicollis TaxID=59894 RepID=UPI0007AD8CEB|nr:PREDICTED: uncharacterized protein LOC101812190 isoform X4 [Ficedula albicollis]